MQNLNTHEEKEKIAFSLAWILTTSNLDDEEDAYRYVKSLEVVLKKINKDKESFKTVMGHTAAPYLQIMELLIDLYKSDKIDIQKKSDMARVLRDIILRNCNRTHPGFSCSLRYVSNAAKLTATEYHNDIKPMVSKLYDALILLCDNCPYKKPLPKN
jgi:hypothetical protein